MRMPLVHSLEMPPLHALTTMLLVSGLLGACGGDSDATADVPDADPSVFDASAADAAAARETITDTRSLEPGELVEGILAGGPNDSAVIVLEAPEMELDWNIHGHANGSTQTIYEELNQISVDYTFEPTAEADWFLLLRNSGSTAMDVSVRIELYGGMTWEWL